MADIAGDDVRALVDIGFIALSAGMVDQAGVIFEGVSAARPEAEAGAIGQALVYLARGEADDAVRILRTVPPTDAAQTFLGLAYARSGRPQDARAVLTAIVESPIASSHAGLARLLLDEIALA